MKQGIFWSKSKNKITKIDDIYRFNQILMYGNISEIKTMIKKEGLITISDVFTHHPTKIYTPQAFNFVKNYILGIKSSLDSNKYVKTLY